MRILFGVFLCSWCQESTMSSRRHTSLSSSSPVELVSAIFINTYLVCLLRKWFEASAFVRRTPGGDVEKLSASGTVIAAMSL